jgi:Holliday junction resolvase RusA-like endonuclease
VPVFEFVVEGPAISSRAARKNAKKYQAWIRTVRDEAKRQWPDGASPTPLDVAVTITNYYEAVPPDVDNVIKPVLDALKMLVYRDDQQVFKVTSGKVDLNLTRRVQNAGPLLAEALERSREFLHVVAEW